MKRVLVLILICAMCLPLFIACEFGEDSDKALFFTAKTNMVDLYASILKNVVGIDGIIEIANSTENKSLSVEAGLNSLILSGEEVLPNKIASILTLATDDNKNIMLNANMSVADESLDASLFLIDEGIVIEAKEVLSKAIFGSYKDMFASDEDGYKSLAETIENILSDNLKGVKEDKEKLKQQKKDSERLLQSYGKEIYDWIPNDRISSSNSNINIYGSASINTKKITLRLSSKDIRDLILVLVDKAINDKDLKSYITKYGESIVEWNDVSDGLKGIKTDLLEETDIDESDWVQIDRYINNKVALREKLTVNTAYGKEYDMFTYDTGFISEKGKDRGYLQVTEKSKHYPYFMDYNINVETNDILPIKGSNSLITTESLVIDATYKSDGVKSEININGEYGDKLKIESIKGEEDTEHNVRLYNDEYEDSDDIRFKLNTAVTNTAEDFSYTVRFRYEDKEDDNINIDCWSGIHLSTSEKYKVNVPDLKDTYNLVSEDDITKIGEELQNWVDNNQNGAFADLLNLFMAK